MRRSVGLLVALILILDIYSILPKSQAKPKMDELTVTGVFHAVVPNADPGTLDGLLDSANLAGHQFVILTSKQASLLRDFERDRNGTSLFIEIESQTPSGQMVSFYSQTQAHSFSDAEIGRAAYAQYMGNPSIPGLFSVASHPSHIEHSWKQLDRFPAGIEIANFESLWLRQASDTTLSFLGTFAIYPFNHFLSFLRLTEIYTKDFLAWDAINSIDPGHFGILGSENNRPLGRYFGNWPGYDEMFRWASNILFLKSPIPSDHTERKNALYTAIKEGRSAIGFQILHPLSGNQARLTCGGKSYGPGDRVSEESGCSIQVKTPSDFPYQKQVRVLRNGELVAESIAPEDEVSFPISAPGAYRVEVNALIKSRLRITLNRYVPYVIYNPIYLR